MQAKARPLETGAHTRTGAWTSGNVYLPTPQHTPRPTLQHLGARRWAPRARRAAHTHLGHTRISLHVDARIHTPGGSQTRTTAPAKMSPTPRWSPLTTPYPVAHPPCAPAAHTRAHTGLSRARRGPHGALGFPSAARAVSPHSPAAALTCSGASPGCSPLPPPGGPPRAGCAPRGGPGCTTWSKFLRFLILGGVGRLGLWGAGGAAAWEAPAGPSAGRTAVCGARGRRPLPAPPPRAPRLLRPWRGPGGAHGLRAAPWPHASGRAPQPGSVRGGFGAWSRCLHLVGGGSE